MSIFTGKRISSNNWYELPINDEAINHKHIILKKFFGEMAFIKQDKKFTFSSANNLGKKSKIEKNKTRIIK